MFRMTSVGSPRLSIGAASTRWRPRLVPSRISRIASGLATPGMVPISTSCVTCSSSERGARLYTPGRSTRSSSIVADAGPPVMMLDGHAREVRHLLAHSSEAVKQCGFSGVRRTDDCDRRETGLTLGGYERCGGCGGTVTIVHRSRLARPVKLAQPLTALIGCYRFRHNPQTRSRFAPQSDFGTVHAENARVAPRSAMRRSHHVTR